MTTEHLIVEEEFVHVFSGMIEDALSNGYTVAASNLFWDFGASRIRYYALLIRSVDVGEIPLTLPVDRPSPHPLDM